MIRYAIAATGAAALILGAAALFLLMFLPGRVQAAECRGQVLTASHYGAESGSRTADGSYFDGSQMIAAHRSWKFNTKLRVSYKGKSVVVVVRDRGPYIRGRALDLSTAAARRIGMVKAGVAKVCVERM